MGSAASSPKKCQPVLPDPPRDQFLVDSQLNRPPVERRSTIQRRSRCEILGGDLPVSDSSSSESEKSAPRASPALGASRPLQRQGSEIQRRKRCSRVSDEILEQVKSASDSEDDIDKLLAELESEDASLCKQGLAMTCDMVTLLSPAKLQRPNFLCSVAM